MNALVTGGAGFIGSNLVALLIDQGFRVRVLDNFSTGYRKNLDGFPVEIIEGDIRDTELTAKACQGVDTIFHLAASIGNVKSLADPHEDATINVIGTVNMLESARKAKVSRLVYSSSAATYGELLTMPIAEDHPQNPDSPYGVSKLAAEKYMLCFAKLYELRVICLRYFNVFGINQRFDAYGNVIPIFAQRLFKHEPLTIYGDGEQTRDFVNVKDVAIANYLASIQPLDDGVFNIGSGRNITINNLAELIQKASGIKAVNIIHSAPRPSEVRHCRADITKATDALGFQPSPDFQGGLAEYWKWFKHDHEKPFSAA